jgi:hypothetical protein
VVDQWQQEHVKRIQEQELQQLRKARNEAVAAAIAAAGEAQERAAAASAAEMALVEANVVAAEAKSAVAALAMEVEAAAEAVVAPGPAFFAFSAPVTTGDTFTFGRQVTTDENNAGGFSFEQSSPVVDVAVSRQSSGGQVLFTEANAEVLQESSFGDGVSCKEELRFAGGESVVSAKGDGPSNKQVDAKKARADKRKMRKQLKPQAKQKAEEKARKRAEERAIQEAEEQEGQEAEERERQEAEERERQEAEERERQEAEEQARQEANGSSSSLFNSKKAATRDFFLPFELCAAITSAMSLFAIGLRSKHRRLRENASSSSHETLSLPRRFLLLRELYGGRCADP